MKSALFAVALVFSGCASMEFDLDPQSQPEAYDYGEWYHDVLFGAVPVSPPVDLNDRCEGRGTRRVRIDGNVVQFAASVVTGFFYDPWRVSYDCNGGRVPASARK